MICTLKKIKYYSIVLSFLILFQSCQIYKKTPVSLQEAVNSELRTKIITTSEEKLVYKQIFAENDTYYSLKNKNGNVVKYPINIESIDELFIKDKKKSTWVSIVVFGLGIPLVFILIGAIICGASGCFTLDSGTGYLVSKP